jgi:glycosyltransferase involved in cell wall biosynthesis
VVEENWYSWGEQLILPWRLSRQKLDLMHFPHFNSPIFYRRKQIITIHDITPMFFPGHKMNSWLRRLGFWLTYKQSLRKAAKIIAVSEHTKHDIVSYFNIRPEKITVIYEGVNEKYFKPVSSEAIAALRQKYGLTKKYLLYIGVWRNHKIVVGCCRAFNQLIKNGFGLSVGFGWPRDPF